MSCMNLDIYEWVMSQMDTSCYRHDRLNSITGFKALRLVINTAFFYCLFLILVPIFTKKLCGTSAIYGRLTYSWAESQEQDFRGFS